MYRSEVISVLYEQNFISFYINTLGPFSRALSHILFYIDFINSDFCIEILLEKQALLFTELCHTYGSVHIAYINMCGNATYNLDRSMRTVKEVH